MASSRSVDASDRTVVLLIAQPGTREREETRDLEHLNNVVNDFQCLRSFFQQTKRADVVAGSAYDATLSVGACLEKLEAFVDEAASVYVIAYMGHGEEGTGDWKMADGKLTFEDLTKIWNARQRCERVDVPVLLVYMDSCFSGIWVKKAQQHRLRDVFVQASCGFDERAVDGRFTPLWIEFQGGALPAPSVLRDLAPYARARLRLMHRKNQRPHSYWPAENVQGCPVKMLDDGAMSCGLSTGQVAPGSPWWRFFGDQWQRSLTNSLAAWNMDYEMSAIETIPVIPSCGVDTAGQWSAEFLDADMHWDVVARLCRESFEHSPCGMCPADMVYLYDAVDVAHADPAVEQKPLQTCNIASMSFTRLAARASSPHQSVYCRSLDGKEEVIVFNHRMPRGVANPPRPGEALHLRQGPLLDLYAQLGAIRHDPTAEQTQFLGPYVLMANQGMAVLRMAAGKETTPFFAARALRAVTEYNIATADVPYLPYFKSDLGTGRASMFVACIASPQLADVYRDAGYEIREDSALRHWWPVTPPDGPWWRSHGHQVPAAPFLAVCRVPESQQT